MACRGNAHAFGWDESADVYPDLTLEVDSSCRVGPLPRLPCSRSTMRYAQTAARTSAPVQCKIWTSPPLPSSHTGCTAPTSYLRDSHHSWYPPPVVQSSRIVANLASPASSRSPLLLDYLTFQGNSAYAQPVRRQTRSKGTVNTGAYFPNYVQNIEPSKTIATSQSEPTIADCSRAAVMPQMPTIGNFQEHNLKPGPSVMPSAADDESYALAVVHRVQLGHVLSTADKLVLRVCVGYALCDADLDILRAAAPLSARHLQETCSPHVAPQMRPFEGSHHVGFAKETGTLFSSSTARKMCSGQLSSPTHHAPLMGFWPQAHRGRDTSTPQVPLELDCTGTPAPSPSRCGPHGVAKGPASPAAHRYPSWTPWRTSPQAFNGNILGSKKCASKPGRSHVLVDELRNGHPIGATWGSHYGTSY